MSKGVTRLINIGLKDLTTPRQRENGTIMVEDPISKHRYGSFTSGYIRKYSKPRHEHPYFRKPYGMGFPLNNRRSNVNMGETFYIMVGNVEDRMDRLIKFIEKSRRLVKQKAYHMDINVEKLKIGQKVQYTPKGCIDTSMIENGMIKEIPEHTTTSVRVVFNCNGDWKNFKDYTSHLTDLEDLKDGWHFEEEKLEEDEELDM